jgi:hypothetical protein
MVSFLSSLVIMQDSSQEETVNAVEVGDKNLKEQEICEKMEEENEIPEEAEDDDYDDDDEEEEEEDGEYYDDEEEEVKSLEDEKLGENERRKISNLAEGRGEMEVGQLRGTHDPDGSDKQTGFGPSPQNKKMKVLCAEGSSTWNKLLNEFSALMKPLDNMTEVSQLVQTLQSMHSIIRCAIEVVVLLESSCHCLPDATLFIFTFFDDNFGDVIKFLMRVLSSSCGRDGEECVVLMCLEMAGTLLHMPETHHTSQQDVRAAITLLSCPWHVQVPPGSDMNCSPSLVLQLTALSSKFPHHLNGVNKQGY